MGIIQVNGKTYRGISISITNGKVIIDGKIQEEEKLSGIVKIVVEGDLTSLKTDENVEVRGNVYGNVDAGGSVTCENVDEYVDAGGSVTCRNVGGDVDAGGSVHCGDVRGDVDAGGSVMHT